jgi:hypothetical protein
VNISVDEALSLLNFWKAEKTVLRVQVSTGGNTRDLEAKISRADTVGTSLKLEAGSQVIEVDLSRAELGGDRRGPRNSQHGAYLVCEFRNDDRWAFYAPRGETV